MLLLVSLLSCTGPTVPEPKAENDVLIVLLDTFRADMMTPERTPVIHQHALESWWPQSSWAPSPWTIPSLSALLTGLPPWELGSADDHGLSAEARSLAERLDSHKSAMFSTNPYVTEGRGFSQGFDRFLQLPSDTEAVEAASDWWSRQGEGPRLMVVLLMSAHLPYEPSKPPPSATPRVGEKFWDLDNWRSYTDSADQSQIRALYMAQLPDLDSHVSRLLKLASADSITAIISDHGEELFEHGGFEHGHAFWEEVTRVHAAIRFPDKAPSRPGGLWPLQEIGQMLAYGAGAPDQESSPEPVQYVVHGYPLSYRDPVIHTWGIRTHTEAYFDGIRPHQSLGGASLGPELESFIAGLNPSGPGNVFRSSEAENAALEAIGYQTERTRPPLALEQNKVESGD